ncbi:hypothetical protein ACFL4N_09250 [Thermodesulfobacteriota bacterium]
MIKKVKECWMLLLTVLVISVWLSHAAAEDGHVDHGDFHRHHMGLFLGNTQEDHEDGITVAADYEYRLTKQVGLGGIAEYIGGDFDAMVFAGLFYVHPYKGLRLVLGPGLETGGSETKYFFRAGVGYRFHVGKGWSITPEVNVDLFERDDAFVYGVSVGRGF